MNETNHLPAEVYQHSYRDSETGQDLRQLVNTPVLGARPAQSQEFTRVSFVGSRTFAIRTPEIGEVGLSQSEIDHAIANAIYMEKLI